MGGWDVSNVRDMSSMFQGATSFNRDISKWKVSRVGSMKDMFRDARSFNRNLCGASWVQSNALKTGMFVGSSGLISREVCPDNSLTSRDICTRTRAALDKSDEVEKSEEPEKPAESEKSEPDKSAETDTSTKQFKISSNNHLKLEVNEYLKKFATGDCSTSDCPQGPIGEWDVSSVTDMSNLFLDAKKFNGDISKWDVSRVTTMKNMFMGAEAFDGDLSKWDVSQVVDMTSMFSGAKSFTSDISMWDVASVKFMTAMFSGAEAFDPFDCKVNWGASLR